jgi:hypothetical protein
MNKRLLVACTGLAAVLCSQISTPAKAANFPAPATKTPSGVTVSPAFQDVQIQADEPRHLLQFSITNNRPTVESIQLSTTDFGALSETGGLFFIGANPTDLQKKYGLSKWLSLPEPSVTIQPKQTTKINAYILNGQTLSPGGHYGALMLALSSENQASSKNNKIALHPIASSLLFITKLGGDTHKLKLNNVDFSHNPLSAPSSVTLRFYNNGNTHLIPRGTVTLTSPGGKVISQGTINQDSNLILPEVYRKYTVPLIKVSTAIRPGNYKLTVNFRFDGYEQFRTYQASIFLLTVPAIVLLAISPMVVVCAIYIYKKYGFRSYFSRLFHRRKNKR